MALSVSEQFLEVFHRLMDVSMSSMAPSLLSKASFVRRGATVYDFRYNQDGLLTKVTDRFGRTTNIKRDRNGRATAIVGPYGQKTTLETYQTGDRDGFLKTLTAPNGASWGLDYWDASRDSTCKSDGSNCEGLLKEMVDPRGHGKPAAEQKKYRHT